MRVFGRSLACWACTLRVGGVYVVDPGHYPSRPVGRIVFKVVAGSELGMGLSLPGSLVLNASHPTVLPGKLIGHHPPPHLIDKTLTMSDKAS